MRNEYVAVLLHGYNFTEAPNEVALDNDISLVSIADSAIKQAYERLCDEEGVDSADPLDYELAVVFGPTGSDDPLRNPNYRYEKLIRVCDVVTLVGECPSTKCFLMRSKDRFQSVSDYEDLPWMGLDSECFYESAETTLSDAKLDLAVHLWERSKEAWLQTKESGRVVNALAHFGDAWRARYLDVITMHLGICFRALFSGHDRKESPNDLAHIVTRFLDSNTDNTAGALKKFFDLDEIIRHGDRADRGDLVQVVPQVFALACGVLRKALIGDGGIQVFEDQRARNSLLHKLRAT